MLYSARSLSDVIYHQELTALGAEAEVIGGEPELNAFATPTIVHFCAVLLIAAFIAMPGQTAGSMSLCLTIAALAGAMVGACTGLSALPPDAVRTIREVNDIEFESLVEGLLELRRR